VHALVLLRRRLHGLFGRSFQLEVRSEVGQGTTVTLRIPLGFENANASLEAVGTNPYPIQRNCIAGQGFVINAG
jgi:hypothetical protein